VLAMQAPLVAGPLMLALLEGTPDASGALRA
jgi:hypothetical protein